MYYQNTWKDQLTRVEYYTNGSLNYYETITYDNSGNIINLIDSRTSYLNKSYQWDGRQLTQIVSYGTSLTFKYNDQGIRTQKVHNSGSLITTNYVLDGDKVLVETRSNGITIYYTYDVDGSLLSMNYNGTEYFYITNLQGDVIELRDMSGYVVVEYKYDAWGNIVYQSPGTLADINPYRYRGYRYDVETGYYYLQSRYYNPQIGRFISADGQVNEGILGENMYAYAENNPVIYIDNDGLKPKRISLLDDNSEWYEMSFFYIEYDFGIFSNRDSITFVKFEIGAISATFKTSKFVSKSGDELYGFLTVKKFNADASLALFALSGKISVSSITAGVSLNDSIRLYSTVYIGYGKGFDFTNGVRVTLPGFEVGIEFNWNKIWDWE